MTIYSSPLWVIHKKIIRQARAQGRNTSHDRFVTARTADKIRNTEAYAQAIEFNRTHGIRPNKRPKVFKILKAQDANPRSKRRVTLPKLKFMEEEKN